MIITMDRDGNPGCLILAVLVVVVLLVFAMNYFNDKQDSDAAKKLSKTSGSSSAMVGEIREDIELPVFSKPTTCVVVLDGHEYFWVSNDRGHVGWCALTHKADCKYCGEKQHEKNN